MKIKIKKPKYGVTKRFNIEDSKQKSQISVVELKKIHMEKHCEKILLLESAAYSKSFQVCIAFFTIYVHNGSNIL